MMCELAAKSRKGTGLQLNVYEFCGSSWRQNMGENNPNGTGATLQLACGLLSDATSLPMSFR